MTTEQQLRIALTKAAAKFRIYEQLHFAKGTNEALEKAAVNAGYAIMCEEALSSLPPSSEKPGELREQFEQAFQLVFQAYSKPGDEFHDDRSWAVWQHRKVMDAFTLMQKVRGALAQPTGAETEQRAELSQTVTGYRFLGDREILQEGDEHEDAPGVWKPVTRAWWGQKVRATNTWRRPAAAAELAREKGAE
jgi:hypothetical protein